MVSELSLGVVMSSTKTRVSLPEPVAYRWKQRLEWYLDDPESYDLSKTAQAACQELSQAPVKVMKTREVYTLPHYGSDHPVTEMVSRILHYAIYDSYGLTGDITSSHESKLQKMRERWVSEGSFSLPKANPRPKADSSVVEHRKAFESMAREFTDHAITLLMRPESPLQVSAAFRDEFALKTSWAETRRLSYGGLTSNNNPYISLALRRFSLDNGGQLPENDRFIEYAQIQASPVIGSSKGSLKVALATLIAHEAAHAAQHSCLHGASTRRRLSVNGGGMSPGVLSKPHGQGWQEIYRYLRSEWVNQMPGYQRHVHTEPG